MQKYTHCAPCTKIDFEKTYLCSLGFLKFLVFQGADDPVLSCEISITK